ncbi:hypothetical protein GALL_152340 [mine drainage metagenome]|uniref:Uncharacterized protein n=1 Tax=mine drainage metagenome TaxID=410659 RepID=A0A1J5SM74_9ZZZZ
MKSEKFEQLLGELMDDLADPCIRTAVEAGEYGFRLYQCTGDDGEEFVLVGDAYFARDEWDQAVEMSFQSLGDCGCNLSLQTVDPADAREALELAVTSVEIQAEQLAAVRSDAEAQRL